MKKILVTGSKGFIAKNLLVRFQNDPNYIFYKFSRDMDISLIPEYLTKVDYVIHLAGENRPKKIDELKKNNEEFTQVLCQKIKEEIENSKRTIKLIFTSSIHAVSDTEYGKSKLEAEKIIKSYSSNKFLTNIFRLPGIFGKWSKPNYNSVVATFCHNIARNLPITVDNPKNIIKLVYIDDLLKDLILSLKMDDNEIYKNIDSEYSISVEDLASSINSFKLSRQNLNIETVGSGLLKLLYSTYLSYLPTDEFSYQLKENNDVRGKFVEVFKGQTIGQVSYLTINTNQERGGHYHHTKTEKFLVVQGKALFRFRDLLTDKFVEISVSEEDSKIVDTIPGWAHDIKNIGSEKLVIIVWANEIYDPKNPDTIQHRVSL